MGGSGGERVDGDDESTEYDKETGAGTDQGNDIQAEDYLIKKKLYAEKMLLDIFILHTSFILKN